MLPAATLLVVGVEAPAEILQVTRERLEESVGLGGERDVITSVRSFEARARDGCQLTGGAFAQHEELRLNAEVEAKAEPRRVRELASQDAARIPGVRLAVIIEVAAEPSFRFVPRQHDGATEVRHRRAFVFVLPCEAHSFAGPHCIKLAAVAHVLESFDRRELRLGDAVDVHERRQTGPHARFRELALQGCDALAVCLESLGYAELWRLRISHCLSRNARMQNASGREDLRERPQEQNWSLRSSLFNGASIGDLSCPRISSPSICR